MSERKVQTRYVSKYFNHELLKKIRKPENKQYCVRMMLPFSICCNSCGNFFKAGTKIAMRKETVEGQTYLGLEIYWLYFKCKICYTEMSMITDPKSHGYQMEQGAVRTYEAYRDQQVETEEQKQIKNKIQEQKGTEALIQMMESTEKEHEINQQITSLIDQTKNKINFQKLSVQEQLQMIQKQKNNTNQ